MRKAEPNDLKRIVEIYNSSISSRMSTADIVPITIENKKNWFDSHNETRPIFVHEVNGYITAWVSFQNFYGRSAYHITAEISIYVIVGIQSKTAKIRLILRKGDYNFSYH